MFKKEKEEKSFFFLSCHVKTRIESEKTNVIVYKLQRSKGNSIHSIALCPNKEESAFHNQTEKHLKQQYAELQDYFNAYFSNMEKCGKQVTKGYMTDFSVIAVFMTIQ